jgi:hypothetical protein
MNEKEEIKTISGEIERISIGDNFINSDDEVSIGIKLLDGEWFSAVGYAETFDFEIGEYVKISYKEVHKGDKTYRNVVNMEIAEMTKEDVSKRDAIGKKKEEWKERIEESKEKQERNVNRRKSMELAVQLKCAKAIPKKEIKEVADLIFEWLEEKK